jgi:hypothetical protein
MRQVQDVFRSAADVAVNNGAVAGIATLLVGLTFEQRKSVWKFISAPFRRGSIVFLGIVFPKILF